MKYSLIRPLLKSVIVAPVRERGLKLRIFLSSVLLLLVAPVRERGLKYSLIRPLLKSVIVAPVRERGLKSRYYQTLFERSSRSRKGAWIEI